MSTSPIRLKALLFASAAIFAVPGAFAQGDGSGTDNLDLLRTGYSSQFCEPAMLCHVARQPRANSAASQQRQQPPASFAPPAPEPRQDPPQPASRLPASTSTISRMADPVPPFDTDLSVTLRGSYTAGGDESSYDAALIPSADFAYERRNLSLGLRLDAEAVFEDGETLRVDNGGADFSLVRTLGPTRELALTTGLTVSQDDPDGLETTETGVKSAPLRVSGNADATFTQEFARAEVSVTSGVARETVSPTTLEDGKVVDNSAENVTALSGGMRLGYEITPIIGAFASANVTREDFDAAAPDLGASRSGWDYALRGGLTGNWSDAVTLEASLGAGRRTFDAAALEAVDTILYGAALEFAPDATRQLRLSFDTAIAPGTDSTAATVDYTLALEAAYRVNTWLGLRASASAVWEEAAGSSAVVRRYAAGAGADIALGAHTGLTLDYEYGLRDDSEATPQVRDEHTIGAGLTLRY